MRFNTVNSAWGLLAAVFSLVVAEASATPPFSYYDSADIDVQGVPSQVDLDGSGTITGAEARLWDVTMITPSIFVAGTNPPPPPAVNPVNVPIKVRIYLPEGYAAQPARNYPVLYLLHGGAGSYIDWSKTGSSGGDIVSTIGASPFDGIVVMVEGGRAGWYSDWVGETDGHFSPKWETYHVEQLVPWVDSNFRTIAERSGRAIAGLSMGGLGAMRYAARYPSTFSAVGSFSGAVEMRYEPFQDTVSNSMWFYGATIGNQGQFQSEYRMTFGGFPEEEETDRLEAIFGPTTSPQPGASHWPENQPGWPSVNPVQLVSSYYGYSGKMAIYSGDSLVWWDGGEEDIVNMNNTFHEALKANGVVHRYCRGFGKHEWGYWKKDLIDFLHYVYGSTPATCTTNSGWSLVP